ncbi:MAG: ATP-binding protein, partial [Patescibacteria group bacterium]
MSKRRPSTYKITDSLNQRQRINRLMRLMDLEAASAQFDRLTEKVEERSGSSHDLIEALLEHEAAYREDYRIDLQKRNAKFVVRKTFDDFDFSFPDKIDRKLINQLRSCDFIDQNKNILILGPYGVGKSHIACALGYEAIQAGYSTRCMTLEQIVEEANKTIDSTKGRKQKLMGLVRTKLLILDEIEETEKPLIISQDATDFLYSLVRKRYESTNSSTIFTFNESFKGWDK